MGKQVFVLPSSFSLPSNVLASVRTKKLYHTHFGRKCKDRLMFMFIHRRTALTLPSISWGRTIQNPSRTQKTGIPLCAHNHVYSWLLYSPAIEWHVSQSTVQTLSFFPFVVAVVAFFTLTHPRSSAVRRHRTGSNNSGVEGYLRRNILKENNTHEVYSTAKETHRAPRTKIRKT